MNMFADILSSVFERRQWIWERPPKPGARLDDLARTLMGNRGEATGMALAHDLLQAYAASSPEARRAFFDFVMHDLDIDADAVRAALAAYENDPGKATYRAYAEAAEPRRQELIRRLNQVPGGTARLVGMRSDLLKILPEAPHLAPLDLDFRHLFASWFNRGFLVLRPINWETPAHLLEKIIAYEAVHAIGSWSALRARLKPADRRCFAFFHPAMPDEPLIFVEVALTRGIPGSVDRLLADDRDETRAADADTAVFYSISNCQTGLAGVSFGHLLIKQVVEDLSRALPGLKTFVTLSPVPGLAGWAKQTGQTLDPAAPDALRQLTARYLLEAKRGEEPRDPVARFHLGNGAILHAVHADADLSEKGRAQSGGAMVNYLYDLRKLAENHDRYAKQATIAASADVRALAKAAKKTDA
ncbi:decarboxylase [Meridianimarinicoccus roseus]|uniref:Decarboxylase n=1 Tax=Meridianimarinicoccus roseus TaxID=2072018 RepID=A0A2V2LHF7_9RHOB|nr:malonyl-CoA decarboxylase family protein [Meridianimarinicoccus roseus]PWR02616.1 decarboxylase [Meridianimarinicoccus roseus]